MDETLFCCRCKEDFPVAEEPATWAMGEMRSMDKAPKRIREMYRDWRERPEAWYLCGNCYIDLTDD